jgi:hypothetical protein
MIEMIFNFHEIYSTISHVISHNFNQICEPFEKFDHFHQLTRNWEQNPKGLKYLFIITCWKG